MPFNGGGVHGHGLRATFPSSLRISVMAKGGKEGGDASASARAALLACGAVMGAFPACKRPFSCSAVPYSHTHTRTLDRTGTHAHWWTQ